MKKQILTTVVVGSLVLAPTMTVDAEEINQTNGQVTIVDSYSDLESVDENVVVDSFNINLNGLVAGDEGTGWTFDGSTLTFNTAATGHEYTITGDTTNINIVVQTGTVTDIILNGVTIESDTSPIAVESGAALNLTIEGENTLVCSDGINAEAGIEVPTGATLTIDGSGYLYVAGGSENESNGGTGAAGIGGSANEDAGTITVSEGTVEAYGNNGGAGIGGGNNGSAGNITIAGTADVTATSERDGAGIGSGHQGEGGNILITDEAIVTAQGGNSAAGIGGGHFSDGGNIEISGDATVNATAGNFGAGIGGGDSGNGGDIIIKDSANVIATSGKYGAGIGGGNLGANGTVAIEDGANVVAFSMSFRSAISSTGNANSAVVDANILNVTQPYTNDKGLIQTLVIYGENGEEVATIDVPAGYNNFAVTTGDYAGDVTIDALDSEGAVLATVETATRTDFAPVTVSPVIDTDGDGLSDSEEAELGTDPLLADTDKDGLTDGEEVEMKTNPKDTDSDNDGLTDGAEVNKYKTNPTNGDSDNDGLNDGKEVEMKTNPKDADSDNDGLTDGVEVNKYSSNPNVGDSDNDGIADGEEVEIGTNPTNGDSDNDGITDGEEVEIGSDPSNPDSDNDGITDGEEVENGTDPTDTDMDDTLADTGSTTYVGAIGTVLAAFGVALFSFRKRG